MPKISIIIPVYNVEKYLRDCLLSIQHQTFTDWEAIIINDGSTDASETICEEFVELNNRFKIYKKQNGGVSSARNLGIEKSTGEYIIFIDPDDYWNNEYTLEILYSTISKNKLDIVRFEYVDINEDGTIQRKRDLTRKRIHEGKILDTYNFISQVICAEWFTWLFLIRKECIDSFRFDENLRFQEDIDFFVKLFGRKKLRCAYLGKSYYSYRHRSGSTMTLPDIKNLGQSFSVCERIYHESMNTQNEDIASLYQHYHIKMYYGIIHCIATSPYYEIKDKIIEELRIKSIQRKIQTNLRSIKTPNKYRLFIAISPTKAIRLIHLKNIITTKLNEWKNIRL